LCGCVGVVAHGSCWAYGGLGVGGPLGYGMQCGTLMRCMRGHSHRDALTPLLAASHAPHTPCLTHPRTHSRTHTHARTRAHTHTHIHTHARTHTAPHPPQVLESSSGFSEALFYLYSQQFIELIRSVALDACRVGRRWAAAAGLRLHLLHNYLILPIDACRVGRRWAAAAGLRLCLCLCLRLLHDNPLGS